MTGPPRKPGRLAGALKSAISRYWGVAAILIVWQGWVTLTGVNAIVMPQPATVVADILISPGIYLRNGGQTLLLAALGLIIGMGLGTLIAVIAWTSRVMSGVLVPLSLVFSSVPIVMLMVLARIFGYDVKTVLAIVVIISFFPAFVFTSAGLKILPPGSDDLFKVLGASPVRRFVHLVAPAALPSWMMALRLAAPPAVLSTMVAEFLMGTAGLGNMFRAAATDFQTDRAFGASVVATIISAICFTASTVAERRVCEKWR